eukprot:TRINITY_DN8492_c0_g1_i1.p1 TRINITY_DN8492_c0_g1~~TRINITY_DN8492_c0_g1_i1.p1  ORF type:complete len:176 (+),score=32.26 TRINITY_DN8492_c0_g1_i1:165-692(+)
MTPVSTSDVEALVAEEEVEVSHPQRTPWNRVIGSVFGVILVSACVTFLVIQVPSAGDAAAAQESVKTDSILQLDSEDEVHGKCVRRKDSQWPANTYEACWNDKVTCQRYANSHTYNLAPAPLAIVKKVMAGGKDDAAEGEPVECEQNHGKKPGFLAHWEKADPDGFKKKNKFIEF